jgi:hypothetical protein
LSVSEHGTLIALLRALDSIADSGDSFPVHPREGTHTMPKDNPIERQMIITLSQQLNAVTEASSATPGCQAIAAIITAAHYASRAGMPPPVAAAMLADYIVHGDPV